MGRNQEKSYISRRVKAFYNAFLGLKHFIKEDVHAKIHIAFVVLVLFGGLFFSISTIEWLICLTCFSAVICAEMINFSLERLTDLVTSTYHPTAKIVKDVAAGAVLFASIMAFIIGCVIFFPKILQFVQTL